MSAHDEAIAAFKDADISDYAYVVGMVISEQVEKVITPLGKLASVLDERPLGTVGDKLDAVGKAFHALLDAVKDEVLPLVEHQ